MRVDLPQRGLHLEYETHGAARDPAVILIMGLGMQLLAWPPQLIDALTARGLRVVVFDNRDIGLSGSGPLSDYTKPERALLAHLWHLPFTPPYRLSDMAADTLALADALDIERFHLVGVSLGGMIAQTLADLAPPRVQSLTSIMSSAGPRTAPWPRLGVLRKFLQRPSREASMDVKLDHFIDLFRDLGHIDDPKEIAALRDRTSRAIQRAYNPAGSVRQLLASLADPDRSAAVARIACPTLILHGAEDPLVPVGAAHHLAKLLPAARLEIIPRLGHYLPAWAAPILTEHILQHVQAAQPPSAKPMRPL